MNFLTSTLPDVPGKAFRILGMIIEEGPYYKVKEKAQRSAEKLGANGLIDIKLHMTGEDIWSAILIGTAVVISDPNEQQYC